MPILVLYPKINLKKNRNYQMFILTLHYMSIIITYL